jgi:CRISPR-associated protein Cst1
VLSCSDDAVEQAFTKRNVTRARRIHQLGFTSLPANASAESVTLEALRTHATAAPSGATLWLFKNDNQEAWLRVTATRGGVPTLLRRMFADPGSRQGWRALSAVLTQRDSDGRVTASGVAATAKLLFDPADRPGEPLADRLPAELIRRARDITGLTAQRARAWRSLFCLYLEVMYQMDPSQVKPVRELIVDWITQEPNPRGRFNEYVRSAASAYKLQQLLMQASARLLLDGRQPPDIAAVASVLLADGPGGRDGWRLRGLLFFDVVADLTARGTPVGHKTDDDDVEDQDAVDALDAADEESEEYA